MDRSIKVFGERNTATMAVQRMIDATDGIVQARDGRAPLPEGLVTPEMLEQSFKSPWLGVYRDALRDVVQSYRGPLSKWKHGAPEFSPAFRDNDVAVLFCVRNPYSWATALFRRPYHMIGPPAESLEELVARPWLTVARDQTDRILASPMHLWSAKLAAYLAFMEQASAAGVATATLHFEEFVCDAGAVFGAAMEAVGITGISPVVDERSTKERGLTAEERRLYYENELWRGDLSVEAVTLINARVDWDVAGRFGYEMIDPATLV